MSHFLKTHIYDDNDKPIALCGFDTSEKPGSNRVYYPPISLKKWWGGPSATNKGELCKSCIKLIPDKIAVICGPIHGVPNFRDGFIRGKKFLEEELGGYVVITPLDSAPNEVAKEELNTNSISPATDTYKYALRKCLQNLLIADEVWVLPGWAQSVGARIEVMTATVCGIPVYNLASGKPITIMPLDLHIFMSAFGQAIKCLLV